jgi:8-oxo-dGTP pyrophosphatase MutT (NUDIX family)
MEQASRFQTMMFSVDTISALLARQQLSDIPPGTDVKTPAAVAMILREDEAGSGLKLLYIQRSAHAGDPWSGNVAFPGGKVEQGEELRRAAERETAEEIGLDLGNALYLGQMPEVRGSYLPVRVSAFVYWLQGPAPALVLNDEVHDTCWAALDELAAAQSHMISKVTFGGERFEAPAIQLAWTGSPVLWGLTYRLTLQFLEMMQSG